VSVDDNNTIEEHPELAPEKLAPEKLAPEKLAPQRAEEPEDEATTLWAKSDLFSADDIEPPEEELFAEKALVNHGHDVRLPGLDTTPVAPPEPPVVPPEPVASHESPPREPPSVPETVRMSPEEAKAAMRSARAAAKDYRASAAPDVGRPPKNGDNVPVAGPSLAKCRSDEISPERAQLTCTCRICSRSVLTPRQRRLRGAINSENGFRCDVCHNVFCAAHVVRVSGLVESLLRMGRFRCVLCDQGTK